MENRKAKVIEIIRFLNKHPEEWEALRSMARAKIKDACIPENLLEEEEIGPMYKYWKRYTQEMNKTIEKDWFPMNLYDANLSFIDMSSDKLPWLVRKQNDIELCIETLVGHPSLVQFVQECKKRKELNQNNETNENDNKYNTSLIIKNLEVIYAFERAWQTLDASIVEPYLSDDFCYSSQWVFEEIKTKEKYMTYLREKFGTIKQGNSLIGAQIAKEGHNGIIITQKDGAEKRKAMLVISAKNGKAIRADLCIPGICFLTDLRKE